MVTSASYDARGRLASVVTGSGSSARNFAFAYDAQGLPSTVTDSLGRKVGMERDAAGRLVRKVLPDGDAIEIGYDDAGDLVSITPPGRPAHTFAYDARGMLAAITPPTVAGTGPTTFAYDADRALTAVARPGESIAFTHDAAGRVSAMELSVDGGPSGRYEFAFDDATGFVSAVTGPAGAITEYGYDGGLLTSMEWGGPVSGTLSLTHDARLAVSSETVNGSSTVSFTHDADDRLVAAGALTITRDATTGLPATTTLGAVSDSWTHNGFGELSDYEARANGTPIYTENFVYDALGRIERRTETIGGVTTTLDYTYDAKGQLASVDRNGVTAESYTYDPNGNRIAATVGGSSVTATYDDQDRLLAYGAATFTHSASGHRITKTVAGGATSYAHDAAGNLLAVNSAGGMSVVYALDPGMRRVARDVGGAPAERFLYSGSRPIAQLDAGGVIVNRFVYAGGTAPAYLVRGGIAHRLVTDHVGSVRLVVNADTGVVVQRLDYDSFGRVTQDTNPGFQPFGFAGGLYDTATGLVHFDAREYDPATGRWLSKDPIGFAGLDANLYRYALNDPVNLTDPNGLVVAEAVAGIVAGLVDVANWQQSMMHAAGSLAAMATRAVLGTPQPFPPDPNPVVGILDLLNDLAFDFLDASGPIVDVDGTAFLAARMCTAIAGDLGVGIGMGATRGAAGAARTGVQSAGGSAGAGARTGARNVGRTADPTYRPGVSGQQSRAERLAADNQARVAREQALQPAGSQPRLELVLPDGNGAGTSAIRKP